MTPTHKVSSDRPVAERLFVDREEPVALFQAALKEPQPAKPLVLVFHGGAGTGKSRLRRELVRLVDSRQQTVDRVVATATLDFDVPVHRQPDAAHLFLRKAIGEDYQIRFPSFDLAYAIYWQKSHAETPPSDELKTLLESGSLLHQLLDDTGKLPLIGLVPKIAALVGKSPEPPNPRTPEPTLRAWWSTRGERELEDLPQMEPAAIVEQLPKLWASDLRDYLGATSHKPQAESEEPIKNQESESYHQDTKTQRGSGRMDTQGRRAVLFVDSYEKLWETGSTEAEFFKRDAWMRELVKHLPEALWVISGRQKLRWEEVEKEWVDVLSQHELGALREHYVREFLNSCGITNDPIQDAIAKGSQGVPHYLNLAVDTFLEIKQSGQRVPAEAESAGTPEELFAQFIRHLDQPEISTLQVLSASRFWNYGLFEHLVTEYQTGYPLTAYDDLSRFSFIGEGAAPETRTMHDLMREALQEHQAPDLRKRVHLFLHEYYTKQLERLDVKGITDNHKAALTEAFYHGRQAKSAEELESWLEEPSNVFSAANQDRLLTPLFREMVQVFETELGPNHPSAAGALCWLACVLKKQEEYAEAEPIYHRALTQAERKHGPEHPLVMDCLLALAELLTTLARYDEAEVLTRRAVGSFDKPGMDAKDRAHALNGLATVLASEGKHAEAEQLFRRALGVYENEMWTDHGQDRSPETEVSRFWLPIHYAGALNRLARLLYQQRRYSEAEPLFRRALAVEEETRGANHPDVAYKLNNTANVLCRLGRYAESEPLHRRAVRILDETLGPDHQQTALAMASLGATFAALDRYAEAEPLLRRAVAVHEKKMGPDHPGTLKMAMGLTLALTKQGNCAEAEPMVLTAIAAREKNLGPNHPDTAHALHTAGVLYSDQGRFAEAEGYLGRAVDTRTRALGPEHQDTLESLDALALLEERRGRYAEAESLYRDVLEKRERVQGPDHSDIAVTTSQLAGICGRDGRYAEAEALYRRALAIREKVFGSDHTFVAEVLDGLAKVCEQTGRAAEAQELSARAQSIREKDAAAAQTQAQSPS